MITPARLSVIIVVLAMIYGVCMGTFAVFRPKGANPMQVLASMVKVPLLFYLTLLVTFPSLYVFNALVGSRLRLVTVVRLLVGSLGVMVTVLASLGPIVAFFSVSTASYPFMLLFNVVSLHGGGHARDGISAPDAASSERRRFAGASRPQSSAFDDCDRARRSPRSAREPRPERARQDGLPALGRSSSRWSAPRWAGCCARSSATPTMPFTWFRARESNFFQAVFRPS